MAFRLRVLTALPQCGGAYLGRELAAKDVACMMALLKLGREAHGHKHDNLLDAAGYIGLASDLAV